MAVKIRLRRGGKKKQPSYRIIATDSRSPRDGRFLEVVGHYDPKLSPPQIDFDENRIRYWLERGATPTDTVKSLLIKKGYKDLLVQKSV
ncbi:30S ribosomal protein S16 [bacterium]|nr:30S ribosomal protein S16 [bacterium]